LDDAAFLDDIDREPTVAKAGIVVVRNDVSTFTSALLAGIDVDASETSVSGDRHHRPHGSFDAIEVGGRRYSADRLALTFPDGNVSQPWFVFPGGREVMVEGALNVNIWVGWF
jgi:hypothetical protein